MRRRAQTSNNIIQKGLAFVRQQSGTYTVPSAERRFGDPAPPACWPRWGFGGGGALPLEPEWRIPMSKPANKRTAKPAKKRSPKAATVKAVVTPPSLSPRTVTLADRKEPDAKNSKQARVVEMLSSPGGATIAAVMKATGWQQHSVRGFFAGVVQKKLRLKLNSEKVAGYRIYRIISAVGTRSSSRRPSRPLA